MTKREMQKIRKRITELKQQQIGLRNENGLHHQAIAEIKEAFDQVQARIEELKTFLPEEKKNAPPSV